MKKIFVKKTKKQKEQADREKIDETHAEFVNRVFKLVAELLEVSIHQILYYREVYQNTFFQSAQRYSIVIKEVQTVLFKFLLE